MDDKNKFLDGLMPIIATNMGQDVEATPTLREYLKLMWPIVNPGTHFYMSWHIEAIADHLEAVTHGEIRNLLINVPPRHTKSFTTSIAWPTWAWIDDPARRFLFASYSMDLSTEHAVQSRRVLESDWFTRRWPHVTLTTDQNVKTRYENSSGGHRTSTSVGGAATGRGADFLVCDDPHNLNEIHSEIMRKAVLDWYRQVWTTRLNDPKMGGKVVIMQRGHMEDLAGELKDAGYTHLNLPTEYDPRKACVTFMPDGAIRWKDPRSETGELLCPERFGPAEVERTKSELLEFGWAAQHQQHPVPYGGGLFKRGWFELVDAAPAAVADKIRFWDCAATVDGGDWTVGTLLSLGNDGTVTVEHVIRTQAGPGDVDRLIIDTAKSDGVDVRVGEEQEPGSAGKSIIAMRARQLGGYAYHTERPTGSKVQRWQPLASQAHSGNVRVVRADWNQAWFDEICSVPFTSHDDQADSAAGAYNTLTLRAPLAVWGGTEEDGDEIRQIVVETDTSLERRVERMGSYFPGD